MLSTLQKFWRNLGGNHPASAEVASRIEPEALGTLPTAPSRPLDLEIAADDPFLSYGLSVHGVIEVEQVKLDSPALQQLKEAGIRISVPLISQGELIGLLNLGARRSEQEYSGDDRRLLANLATQAAPALRVAQLARQQQAEARQRERIEQELRVARVIQETLLPHQLPELPGWKMGAHWQPARAVSGDFYDFIAYPQGRLGVVMADVTDKGVPAALVMATTRSILRSTAERLDSPGQVLEQANNLLCVDMPDNMYVTCLYAVLEPATGHLCYANAGHPPAFQRSARGVEPLLAHGMPLGLLEGMTYEEKETTLAPGDSLLMYSDGLVEAHNPQRDMFSFPRLREKISAATCNAELVKCLLDELSAFTGPDWEQEDDVTLLTIEREGELPGKSPNLGEGWQVLTEFTLPSQPGNEKEAMQKVAQAVLQFGFPPAQVERLKTAVAEATMNAMEHGNRFRAELPVEIRAWGSPEAVRVWIVDQGGEREDPATEQPNLEAKLEGMQSPRGWGLFLIQNMVDEMNTFRQGQCHTVELVIRRSGGKK